MEGSQGEKGGEEREEKGFGFRARQRTLKDKGEGGDRSSGTPEKGLERSLSYWRPNALLTGHQEAHLTTEGSQYG